MINKFQIGDRFEDQKYGHIYALRICKNPKFDVEIFDTQCRGLQSTDYVTINEIEESIGRGRLRKIY